jgi:hypothetical protein
VGDGDGESAHRSMSPSESVGELAIDDEALEVSESMDSSLILVWSGRSTFTPFSATLSTLCMGYRFSTIDPVDLEYGESSIGVTLMRDEGESKDCARMRTFGDGVLSGTIMVAMMLRHDDYSKLLLEFGWKMSKGLDGVERGPQARPEDQFCSQ